MINRRFDLVTGFPRLSSISSSSSPIASLQNQYMGRRSKEGEGRGGEGGGERESIEGEGEG